MFQVASNASPSSANARRRTGSKPGVETTISTVSSLVYISFGKHKGQTSRAAPQTMRFVAATPIEAREIVALASLYRGRANRHSFATIMSTRHRKASVTDRAAVQLTAGSPRVKGRNSIGSESDLSFDGRAAGTVFDGKRASATGLSLVSGQQSLSAASGRQMKSSSASSSSLSSFSSMLGDRAVRRSSTAGLENEHTAAAAAAQRPSKARNIHRHSSSVM